MASIIVVDDEVAVAAIVAAALSDEGHDPVIAGHGAHALSHLDIYPGARLVISDFRMPVMDGAGLLRAMRIHPVHQHTPMVFMSSMPEDYVRQRVGGYVGFIRKPFKIADIIAVVEKVLAIPTHTLQ